MLTRLLTAHQSEVKHNEDYESWVKDSQANQEPTNDFFKEFLYQSSVLYDSMYCHLLKKFAAISGVERTMIDTKLPNSPKNPSMGRRIPWL